MSDTTVTEVPVEAPVVTEEPTPSTEVQEVAPEVTEDAPASPEGQEETATEVEPLDTVLENLQAREDFKAHLEEVKAESQRQGQLREYGQRKQIQEQLSAIHDDFLPHISALNETLATLGKDGNVKAVVMEAFQKHAPGLLAYQMLNAKHLADMQQNARAGGTYMLAQGLANAFGLKGPTVDETLQRFATWEQNGVDAQGEPVWTARAATEFEFDGSKGAFKALVKMIEKELTGKGFQSGKGFDKTAKVEGAKIEARNGQGPPSKTGGAGGKSYSSLEEAKLAHARDEISNNRMRELKAQFLQAERDR